MDKLPKEVLYLISSYIDLPDRLCCLRVCKYFYKIFINVTYQNLILDTPNKFDKAFLAFNSKKELGHQISTLQIYSCELDDFTLLSLPDLFPKVKRLVWESTIKFGPCYQRTYIRQLKKWKYIESADITISERFDFSRYLLEASAFINLSQLTIRCLTTDNHCLAVLDSLKSNFKNIPSLTSLFLEGFILDIDDLESIHKESSKLKMFLVKDTDIMLKSNVSIIAPDVGNSTLIDRHGNQSIIQPSTCTKVFHLTIKTDPLEITNISTRRLKEKITNWIQYISIKYPNLSALTINSNSVKRLLPMYEFEQDVVNLISKMNSLIYYCMRLEPLTNRIIQAIEENNNIKLDTIEIWIINQNDTNIQLNNLTVKKLTESINHLKINDLAIQHRSNFQYTDIMVNHLEQFKYLSRLELKTTRNCGNNYSLLINIIQKIPNLNILAIEDFTCDYIKDTSLNTITKSKIRELKLGVTIRRKGVRSHLNNIFRFCIQSCPKLTTFNVKGKLKCNWGNINLDFRENIHIQNIKINIKGCAFYTFNTLSFTPGTFTPYCDYNEPCLKLLPILNPLNPIPSNLKGSFFINILHNRHISFDLAKTDILE